MKREKLFSSLIACVVAFCMGFGAMASVATGLGLDADMSQLFWGCLLGAAIAATAYSLQYGGRVLLVSGGLWLLVTVLNSDFTEQLMSIFGSAAKIYGRAYGFAVPPGLLRASAADQLLPLLVVAGLIQMVTAWIILHRYPASLAVFLAVLPLISCFIVTDTVPEVWPLSIWLFGLAMLVLTQSVRIRSTKSGNRLAALLAVPLLLGLSLLVAVVPEAGFQPPVDQTRLQGMAEWALEQMPFVGQTSDGKFVINFGGDRGDTVDLASLDDRKFGDSVVAEVEPDWTGTLYLRGRDYDSYTGEGWKSTDRAETLAPPERFAGEQVYLRVQVFGNRKQLLVPYYADEELPLESGAVPADDRSYSFNVVLLSEKWKKQWRGGTYGDGVTVDPCYLALPQDTYEDACKILEEIDGLDGDSVAAADAIGGYVSRSARYSLKVDQMPEDRDDFAIWFLNDADRGYCVHFATAATVLLRANGIPARYVEGYILDAEAFEINEVKQEDAHAWVEYYVEGVGWVVLDPTPGIGREFEEPTAPTNPTTPTPKPTTPTAPTTRPTTPTTTPTPSVTEPSTSSSTRPSSGTNPTGSGQTATSTGTDTEIAQTTGGGSAPEPEPMPTWLVRLLIGLAVAAAMLVAVVGQWIVRRWRRLRRLDRGAPNRRVIARYREAQRICRAVKAELPPELEHLAEKAGYSQHTITREELTAANAAFKQCFALLEKGRWYQKLIWRFIYALY